MILDSVARLGVFGGSGLYKMPGMEPLEDIRIETPFGATSDVIKLGLLNGQEVAFLARHGQGHCLNPSEVPYQANVWAMRYLNVKWLLSASAVGSLKPRIKPLDILVPDQFIDRTRNRPATFFEGGVVAHVAMADPFCLQFRHLLLESIHQLELGDRSLHDGGTYVCMEGPAFSTRAESEMYRALGGAVIGMTNHTEARLAREAEIAYASLCMVTDYDCWHQSHESVTVDMIVENLNSNARLAAQVVSQVAQNILLNPLDSDAHSCLKNALLTRPEAAKQEAKAKLQLFLSKYWDV